MPRWRGSRRNSRRPAWRSRQRRRSTPSRSTITTSRTRSGFPAAAEDLAAAIRAADGVLICSPEYNWSIPGVLKNAIDWVSRMKDQPFAMKPVAIQSAATGCWAARACSITCANR